MRWTFKDLPVELKVLQPKVREKALEIANELISKAIKEMKQ